MVKGPQRKSYAYRRVLKDRSDASKQGQAVDLTLPRLGSGVRIPSPAPLSQTPKAVGDRGFLFAKASRQAEQAWNTIRALRLPIETIIAGRIARNPQLLGPPDDCALPHYGGQDR